MPDTNELLHVNNILNLYKPADIKFAEIDSTGAGTHTIIGNPDSESIRVLSYTISSNVTSAFKFQDSDAGDVHPAYTVKNTVRTTSNLYGGCFELDPELGLNFETNTGNVRGFLTYTLQPVNGEGHSVETFLNYHAPWDLKFADISIVGSATPTLVSAVAGKKIRVLGICMGATASADFLWKDSDSANLTGQYKAGSGAVHNDFFLPGFLETPVGKGLKLNHVGSATVGGYINYIEV